MRYLKAFILSVIIAGASSVFAAVFLGVFNIYLSGHGIDWPSQEFESGMTEMSPLDVAFVVFVLLVFVTSFLVALKIFRDAEQKRDD